MKRVQRGDPPVWDLSAFYKGPSDPRINEDLLAAYIGAQEFELTYRGKIDSNEISPELLAQVLEDFEAISNRIARVTRYSEMLLDERGANPSTRALGEKVTECSIKVRERTLFLDSELASLGERFLAFLASHAPLEKYRQFLGEKIGYQSHQLSEELEAFIERATCAGGLAFARMYVDERNSLRFRVGRGKNSRVVSEPQILDMLQSPRRTTRKAATEAIHRGISKEAVLARLASLMNMAVQWHALEDDTRNFSRPESRECLANGIELKTLDAMCSALEKNRSLVHRFFRFKQRILGHGTFHDWDLYAPPSLTRERFSWKEARDVICSGSSRFSTEYGELVEEFFRKRWIHARADRAKSSSLSCNDGTLDTHPAIIMNFHGSVSDVIDLAHELGHGAHARLSAKRQTYLNFDSSLPISETASAVSELIVFNELRRLVRSKKQKLALYTRMLEGHIFERYSGGVFKPLVLHRFEQEFHRIRREKGELTPEDLDRLWIAANKKILGNSVTLSPNYSHLWALNENFVEVPFYHSSYPCGSLLGFIIYKRCETEGAPFIEKYLNMLSAGSSKSLTELLRGLGISIDDPAVWDEGILYLRNLIEEAEQLFEEL